jgi:hypothetical protein
MHQQMACLNDGAKRHVGVSTPQAKWVQPQSNNIRSAWVMRPNHRFVNELTIGIAFRQ